MKATTLYRIAGLTTITGAALGIAAYNLHPSGPPADLAQYAQATHLSHSLMFFAGVLTIFSFPAVFVRLRERMNVLGLIALFTLLFTIAASEMRHAIIEVSVVPALVQTHTDPYALIGAIYGEPVFSGLENILNMLLLVAVPAFAFFSVRAGLLPRWVGFGALGLLVFTVLSALVMVMPDMPIPGDLFDHIYGSILYGSFGIYGLGLLVRPQELEAQENMPLVQQAYSAS